MIDTNGGIDLVRSAAEVVYAHELEALARLDDRPRPPRWKLSPWAVAQYLLGAELSDGTTIVPKYYGRRRVIEIAVATLAIGALAAPAQFLTERDRRS